MTPISLKITNILYWIGRQTKRRRWLFMILFGTMVVIVESLEHIRRKESLATLHFTNEVLIYGFAIPVSVAVLLALVDKAEVTRNELAVELQREHEFSTRLRNAVNRDDLVKLILQFPESVFPVKSSALLISKHDGTGFSMAGSLGLDSASSSEAEPHIDQCQSCTILSYPFNKLNRCSSSDVDRSGDRLVRYCLPLAYQSSVAGILTFSTKEDQIITSKQSDMLAHFIPEIVLALENDRLQNMVQYQMTASIAERERIAKDLHDTLGQSISYLRLRLDQITYQYNLYDIAEIGNELTRMRDIANEAYLQIRGTLADLHPSTQQDFLEALRLHTEKVCARTGLEIEIRTQGIPLNLPGNIKRQALYICREALNNIEKHAYAKSVKIDLLWTRDDLTIMIVDDGFGFKPATIYDMEHLGLTIMTERADSIGAQLELDSKPGQGTKVLLWIPLSVTQT